MSARATQKAKPAKRKTGTLAVIGSLLLISAVMRIAIEAGPVIASEALGQAKATSEEPAFGKDLHAPQDIAPLIEAMKKREARIKAQEEELTLREHTMKVAEVEIAKQMALLQETEASLEATIARASVAAEEDLTQLTSVYANMKPKQASALFEQMESSFAAGFLSRMPPGSAARVLAGMTPEKAYLISVELAGRNADIPLE
ncbi:MotE family protein [Marivita hallyeonensis]|uniref:Flagellar motility protein MotE, a chaperone for MotC folding n=1 Tax=Marivita hallyeonensis TaxID=996342 RepID=A0A1M5XU87_9RHOB|nr:hypothetical protein [Marivita hallyeonensis]SHI03299.1 Flagellar motility protein MotE, a chaperone for MotC folding [Marivita hallyeonensis]